MSEPKEETEKTLWWIDRYAKLRSPKEIEFIANMIDEPPDEFSDAQLKWINDIYDRVV